MKSSQTVGMMLLTITFVTGLLIGCWCDALAQGYGQSRMAIRSSPTMALPDTIFVAVDREFNVWDDQLSNIQFPSQPFKYSAVSAVGQIENRSFRWTPSSAENASLVITAYDYGLNSLGSASTVLSGVTNDSGSGQKKVLFIGDSLTASGYFPAEVDSIFNVDGGGDIVCIGTILTNDDCYHEGRGGWKWERYATDYTGNPFWDSGRIDFQSYSTDDLGGLEPDYVVITLGGNEAATAAINDEPFDPTETIDYATAFLDTMFSKTYGWDGCKVILNIPPPGSGHPSSFGDDYGAEWSPYDYQKNLRALTQAYISIFDGGRYSDDVDVCASNVWVDPTYGYPVGTKAISSRETDTETYGTNYLHPTEGGYHQVADAVYSMLRYYVGGELVCTNEMPESWDFSDGTYWVDLSAFYTITSGEADPLGGTLGTSYESTTTTTVNLGSYTPANDCGNASDMTASVWVDPVNLATDDVTRFRVRNTTDGEITACNVTWASTPTIALEGADQIGIDDYGVEDRGSGWYQIWVSWDNSADGSDSIKLECSPLRYPAVGDEIIIGGFQAEYEVLIPCGLYVATP